MLVDNADLASRVAGLDIPHASFRAELVTGVDLAGWVMVGRVLLTLDEFLTKE